MNMVVRPSGSGQQTHGQEKKNTKFVLYELKREEKFITYKRTKIKFNNEQPEA